MSLWPNLSIYTRKTNSQKPSGVPNVSVSVENVKPEEESDVLFKERGSASTLRHAHLNHNARSVAQLTACAHLVRSASYPCRRAIISANRDRASIIL